MASIVCRPFVLYGRSVLGEGACPGRGRRGTRTRPQALDSSTSTSCWLVLDDFGRCPQIGTWQSWEEETEPGAGLDVRDIVWPGMSHTPPQGVPEKFHLRIAFLEEPPYVNLEPLDPVTNKCPLNRGVHCRVGRDDTPRQALL